MRKVLLMLVMTTAAMADVSTSWGQNSVPLKIWTQPDYVRINFSNPPSGLPCQTDEYQFILSRAEVGDVTYKNMYAMIILAWQNQSKMELQWSWPNCSSEGGGAKLKGASIRN